MTPPMTTPKRYGHFEYKDFDYLESPDSWLAARLGNRLKEGFEIWRDDKNMSWKGIQK